MNEEQNIIPEELNNTACFAAQWEAVKKEVFTAVDEKFDVEAVAQMVEQLEFSKKLNCSLQQSFQSLQAELQRKDQMILYLQGRLDNLELDIALLKRTVISPYPFTTPPPVLQSQIMPQADMQPRNLTGSLPEPVSPQNPTSVKPPDFSTLRKMTVAEPAKKFVPPTKPEVEDAKIPAMHEEYLT